VVEEQMVENRSGKKNRLLVDGVLVDGFVGRMVKTMWKTR